MITKIMPIIHMLIVILTIVSGLILIFAISYLFFFPYDLMLDDTLTLCVKVSLRLTVIFSAVSVSFSILGIILKKINTIKEDNTFLDKANVLLSALTVAISLISMLFFWAGYAGSHY